MTQAKYLLKVFSKGWHQALLKKTNEQKLEIPDSIIILRAGSGVGLSVWIPALPT